MSTEFVYLASGSPRRRELLQQIGVSFRVLGAAVDETVLPGEAPAAYVGRLAAAKAACGWESRRDGMEVPVLAADTAVVLDGKIFGKPCDRRDAERMLRQLSGRTHEVLTAVALRTASGLQARLSRSEVTFRAISAGEARRLIGIPGSRRQGGRLRNPGSGPQCSSRTCAAASRVSWGCRCSRPRELLRAAGVPRWHKTGTCADGH